MNSRFLIVGLFVVLAVSVCWAIDNPAVRSPVGSATVPPSSLQSGLYRSPNPIDTSSNLVITGNVGGGRHFRGIVPYQSVTEFGVDIPTSSLDSFLRRSAGSAEFNRFTACPLPYYSVSKTVTTTQPGYSVVFRPPVSQIRTARGAELPAILQTDKKDFIELGQQLPLTKLRPMSKTPKQILSEVEKYIKQAELLAAQTEKSEKDGFGLEPGYKAERSEEIKLEVGTEQIPLKPPVPESDLDVKELFELQKQRLEKQQRERADVYEQMKKQVDELIKEMPKEQEAEDDAEGKIEEGNSDGAEVKSEADKFAELSLAAAKAERILAEHKTFAAYTEDNFDRYLRAGEKYLKEGKCYLAADAFTMALLYKPDNPLAYAGKSHSLFAAGEYMSSALFLARALEIFPEYALFKIDIEAMIGDRDRIETRMADVKDWVKISRAGELEFLLAYVYFQMGRHGEAKESIDIAFENMPDSSAVATLRKVIYDRAD